MRNSLSHVYLGLIEKIGKRYADLVIHNFGGNTYDEASHVATPVIQMLNDLIGMRVSNISNYKRKISDSSMVPPDEAETWPANSNIGFQPSGLKRKISEGGEVDRDPETPELDKASSKASGGRSHKSSYRKNSDPHTTPKKNHAELVIVKGQSEIVRPDQGLGPIPFPKINKFDEEGRRDSFDSFNEK
jgi:hypothetical protein